MIYENVFNCDVWNFELYKNLNQNGLYVRPDKNLKENFIITLLERDHETEMYTGRYLNYMIVDISADHKNKLLANLWYLNCKLVDQGFSGFLNGKLKEVLNHRNINKSEIKKFSYSDKQIDETIRKTIASKTKNQISNKTETSKRKGHEK